MRVSLGFADVALKRGGRIRSRRVAVGRRMILSSCPAATDESAGALVSLRRHLRVQLGLLQTAAGGRKSPLPTREFRNALVSSA